MAGFMDMFGGGDGGNSGMFGGMFGGGDVYGDLLTDEQKQRMQQQTMMTMAAKLLQAGGPSTTRTNLGQALGGAFLSGQEAYGKAGQNAVQGMLTKQKIEEYRNEQKQNKSFDNYLQGFMGGGQQQAVTPSPADITLGATPQASTPMAGGAPTGSTMPGGQSMITPQQAMLLSGMPRADASKVMLDMSMRQDPEIIRTLAALGMAPTPENYMALKKSGAPVTTITNTVQGAADKALAGAVGGDVQNAMRMATDQATAAKGTLGNIQNIRANIDSAILGPAADMRTTMLRMGQVLGVSGKDDVDILAKTRSVVQGMAQEELNAASQMKGQGPLTDSERVILRKAALGDQNMSAPEIRIAMTAMEKIAQVKISTHGNLLKSFSAMPGMKAFVPFYSVGGDMGSAIDAELRKRSAQ